MRSKKKKKEKSSLDINELQMIYGSTYVWGLYKLTSVGLLQYP